MTKNEIESEILALKQLLTASDYKTLKYSEGLISETEYTEIRAYRENLRLQINQLENELSKLLESELSI